MEISPVDPRVAKYENDQPSYWVIFWSQPDDSDIPSDLMGWQSSEHRVTEAEDVHEVVAWASADKQQRAYTLYVESKGDGDAIVVSRLSGSDPTVNHKYSHFVVGDSTIDG